MGVFFFVSHAHHAATGHKLNGPFPFEGDTLGFLVIDLCVPTWALVPLNQIGDKARQHLGGRLGVLRVSIKGHLKAADRWFAGKCFVTP